MVIILTPIDRSDLHRRPEAGSAAYLQDRGDSTVCG